MRCKAGFCLAQDERGPDEDFRLRFEALSRLDKDERVVVKELIDGMLLKHEARRLSTRLNAMNEDTSRCP